VADAVNTLNAYIVDPDYAPLEGPEIRQVERDIIALKDRTLTSTIAERRKKLNDDIGKLYAKDQWLQGQAVL
jgi:hypothetical protein